ncbi:MAG TPA: hypothetical protein VGN08_05740 [Solirubrobacteraceae bacterium]|jgi:hypothetical protein
MRRASTCLAVVGLAVLAIASTASATPVVTLKAKAVPIPGFSHTGNFLGAGAAAEATFHISGTEYAGFPPPVIGINFFLPTGSKIHTAGFKTCPTPTLEAKEPAKCPKAAKAGPTGHAEGVVRFGKGEPTKESVTIESFYIAGGLGFYTEGHSPVQLEFFSKGKYTSLGGGGGFGPELITEVPLVETVPGAPDASVEFINVKVGSAFKSHGKPVFYGMTPKKCKGSWKGKAEVLFAGLGGLSPQTVSVPYSLPCPKH